MIYPFSTQATSEDINTFVLIKRSRNITVVNVI
ncbi:hypothetical protein NIES4071_49510 [Calothrix sp. NIES-4071]|nr:hypothetical protein NIES4071_49510 [Calothrix sp. NIES-4071]BAZ59258.1 hypothetical protein NIES4105_49450 [Calothrix sp. NIES-4105]